MIVILAFLLIAIFIVTLIYGIFFERKLGASKEIKLLFMLDELKRKVDIINTTADRNEFEKNLSEIKKGLRYLSRHEYLGIFYNSTPSKDFHRLLESEPEIRNLFELREKDLLRDNNEDILPDNSKRQILRSS